MGNEWISANEFALTVGKSRQWISLLCKQGRIPGAYKAGKTWMINAMSPLPVNGNSVSRAERRARREQRRAERAFEVKHGLSIAEIERVPEARVMTPEQELARQVEIDRWVDQGADIDDTGTVVLRGEAVWHFKVWGDFERKWYRVSNDSI